METTITIKKNKPAFKALILLAKELEKNNTSSISIIEVPAKLNSDKGLQLILPKRDLEDLSVVLDQLSDFPTLKKIRRIAWPKNLL